ncbi:MAG TPA: four helix bundle protein [Thermoanaerobaculaceae bacterium]|nr:four helix bundle protein [Thermoanaerobaculaceae bacterium]
MVEEKSFEFALEVVELYKVLKASREFVLPRELLRAGTSIGANVEEASAGQSRKDFLSKMSIALKEAREARYWLLLLHRSQLVPADTKPCLEKVEELIRLLASIVKTTKESTTPEALGASRLTRGARN